ncbi:MAG: nitrate reductase [Desulfobacteraceae bacterium IS3]|nr:MAG: nitrate reductase [Desulfobacteraceae bacterium IS3]
MHTLYNLVSGPLVWLSFLIFIGGSIYRITTMASLAKEKDSAVFEYMNFYYASRSIVHWIVPFGSENMKKHPGMTVVTFVFHICLICLPLFVFAHVILWKESWNISWWYLSDGLADLMTLAVIASCIFFLVRRLTVPEVKYLTSNSDFVILALVAAPFVTGFWAYHQLPAYRLMGILHILSGEIMLAAIPFTRLSHALFFLFTRGYTGSEFGAVKNAKDW